VYKNKLKLYLWLGCGIVCILITTSVLYWGKHTAPDNIKDNAVETGDIKDTSVLRLAKPLEQEESTVKMSLVSTPIKSNVKEIVVELENLTENDFCIPMNEIIVDRLLNGKWYFWGIYGNAYEVAYGVSPHRTEQFNYHLRKENLTDADYMERYDGKRVVAGGKEVYGDNEVEFLLFPGTYRIRMEGEIFLESQEEPINCEPS